MTFTFFMTESQWLPYREFFDLISQIHYKILLKHHLVYSLLLFVNVFGTFARHTEPQRHAATSYHTQTKSLQHFVWILSFVFMSKRKKDEENTEENGNENESTSKSNTKNKHAKKQKKNWQQQLKYPSIWNKQRKRCRNLWEQSLQTIKTFVAMQRTWRFVPFQMTDCLQYLNDLFYLWTKKL